MSASNIFYAVSNDIPSVQVFQVNICVGESCMLEYQYSLFVVCPYSCKSSSVNWMVGIWSFSLFRDVKILYKEVQKEKISLDSLESACST